MGKARLQISAVFAEMERSLMLESTKAELSAARALGRSAPALSPTKLDTVRRLMKEPMLNMGEIAERVGGSRSAVYRKLGCPGRLQQRPANRLDRTQGDTGYGDGAIFRAMKVDYEVPTLAVLPIDAYEPRWFMQVQHVNPVDAVRIFEACGTDAAVGTHWGTFPLTDEGREDPAQALKAVFAVARVRRARLPAFRPGDIWTAQTSPGAFYDFLETRQLTIGTGQC